MNNPNNPQTPGVYTVEKNAFPNAVAAVPTAIPAFVGYTQKAERSGKSVINQAISIGSLLEYEQVFGGAPDFSFPIFQVIQNQATDQAPQPPKPYDFKIYGKYYKVGDFVPGKMFYLYNSLRLFYQNGGGPCYVVSVGTYEKEAFDDKGNLDMQINPPDKEPILDGLEIVKSIQFPKPTLILIPDSLLLSEADYYTVQQQVLMQCGELQNRVGLIDVYDGYMSNDDGGVITKFRNSIGNNFLNYGISYYPFLETTIVDVSDVTYANVDQTAPNAVALKDIFVGEQALGLLDQISKDYSTLLNLPTPPKVDFTAGNKITIPTSADPTTGTQYFSWNQAYNGYSPSATPTEILAWQASVIYTEALVLYTLATTKQLTDPAVGPIENANLISDIQNLISPTGYLASLLIKMYAYDSSVSVDGKASPLGVFTEASLANFKITLPSSTPVSPYPENSDIGQIFDLASPIFKIVFSAFQTAIDQVSQTAMTLLRQYNSSLVNSNTDYKNLMEGIAKKASILPPTPAMAGIYTLVDNSQGVWNAPANININSVIAPSVNINNDQQASLNVDALAGKSINAIRSFFGQGPAIVWGARTLDGNSLDWRYVNVRRTAIFIEQSIANAAFSLVFRPNDASTWTTMESLISNFLHNLWSEGALQGSTPQDAYSVAVGLGKTMTPMDILEGIMRVQVKLALVRPAEFIIITYQQEMAKS